jgi:PKD repeat protein
MSHRGTFASNRRATLLLLALLLPVAPPLGADGSSQQNPSAVFSTPGLKTVTLTVCRSGSCSTTTKIIRVLDPAPVLSFAAVQPASLEVGQLVALSAGATGKPPLSYSWSVYRQGTRVATLAGAAPFWATGGLAPGSYVAAVTAESPWGTATSDPIPITLSPPRASAFYTVKSCRVFDSRTGQTPLTSAEPTRRLPLVSSSCAIPAAASAVAANVTVVAPSATGHLTLYPGNYPPPATSTLNFHAGQTRANNAILSLATDGSGTLAVRLTAPAPARVDVLLDVAGYFLPTVDPTPVALGFRAKLCSYGFCIVPASTPLYFVERIGGLPTLYRYDWDGNGGFEESSSAPDLVHSFASTGFFTPQLEASRGSIRSTVSHDGTIAVTPAEPFALPPTPTGLSATFLALLPPDPLDPSQTTLRPTFLVGVSSPPPGLLGYNAYLSLNGGPFRLAYALLPGLPATDPLSVPLFDPAHDTLLLALTAVSYAGESPRSAAVRLSFPASVLPAAAAALSLH